MTKNVKTLPIPGKSSAMICRTVFPESLFTSLIILNKEMESFMSAVTTANPIRATRDSDNRWLARPDAGEGRRHVNPPQIQNILVALDFSDVSTAVLRYATFLAESFGATLTLVHSVEPCAYPEDLSAGFTIEEVEARWIKKHEQQMEVFRQTIHEGIPSTVVVTTGTARSVIVATAKSHNADLIVIGTHGRAGLKHVLTGSTADRVVRHATWPVLVVPSYPAC